MTPKNPFEVPTEMRDLAGRSVEQARKAFETFIGAAHQSASMADGSGNPVQQGIADATRKTVSFAETNVKAAFDLAQQLVQAKTIEEVLKLQTEFVQNQARTIQTQMQEAGATLQKQFGDATSAVQNMGKKPPKG